jgi:dTMP kinase
VLVTREPGGSPLAERLRAIVLERGPECITPAAETLLMFAARSIHIENRIRPALEQGQWVICDRYSDATRAYQGAGRGVDSALIEALAQAVHPQLWPQRTLVLDLPVEQGLARARARAGGGDRFEDQDRQFFERVRARYRELAVAEPLRVRLIDAIPAPQQVAANALAALSDLL